MKEPSTDYVYKEKKCLVKSGKDKVLLINRVNPDRVLDAQREISNAITTAIITNEPTGELELLKSDIENLKSHISQ